MALNMSRQMYSNRFVGDGSPDRGGDGCAKPWHCSKVVEDRFDYHEDRGGSNKAVNDILDVLPRDPFGMDISTTFTAITGWLEDLDYTAYGSYETGSSKGEYELFAGFNFIWNSALKFHSLPVNFGVRVDEASSAAGRFGGDIVTQQSSSSTGCSVAADCTVDDILYKLPGDSVFHQSQDDQSVSGSSFDGDYHSPHQALFFALSYLGVQDLLACEGVCRSLCSTIKTDALLWRNINIGQPLNEKLSDDILLQLTSRAQGYLQSLSLVECLKITDDGLKHVLESNPRLTTLNVPGCTRLSIEGIVNNLKAFSALGTPGIKCLRIGGVYGVTQKHLDELKLLLPTGKKLQQSSQKPHFYRRDSYYLPCDDDQHPIDIEPCPICQSMRLVYDCPIEGCPGSNASQTCRACTFCIQRCIQCGQCINDSVYVENFCMEYLCADCWNQLPKHHGSVSNSDVLSTHGEPSNSPFSDG
ncbi:unnamed protein product [Rhodiola kirilowii]